MSRSYDTYSGSELDRKIRDLENLLRRAEADLREARNSNSVLLTHCNRLKIDNDQLLFFARDLMANLNGDLVAVWSWHHRVTSKL